MTDDICPVIHRAGVRDRLPRLNLVMHFQGHHHPSPVLSTLWVDEQTELPVDSLWVLHIHPLMTGRGIQPPSPPFPPVHCSDLRVDSQKQRHPSGGGGGVSVSSEMVFELEGVELGADGKARALWPASGRQS